MVTVNKPAAWSYSRLVSFETCPRKFFRLNIAKDLKEPESEAMAAGTAIHLAFANYIRGKSALPLHLRHHEPILAKIKSAPGEKSIEQQIALDARWEITDWFGKDAWLRVISDLTQINGNHAVCWDYKTGKQTYDFTQLKLNAAVTMHLAPEVEAVTVAFYWTKTKTPDSIVVKRSELPELWGGLLARVAKYQEAHDRQDFPPKQNNFCKGCIVQDCQFWQPKKGS